MKQSNDAPSHDAFLTRTWNVGVVSRQWPECDALPPSETKDASMDWVM